MPHKWFSENSWRNKYGGKRKLAILCSFIWETVQIYIFHRNYSSNLIFLSFLFSSFLANLFTSFSENCLWLSWLFFWKQFWTCTKHSNNDSYLFIFPRLKAWLLPVHKLSRAYVCKRVSSLIYSFAWKKCVYFCCYSSFIIIIIFSLGQAFYLI